MYMYNCLDPLDFIRRWPTLFCIALFSTANFMERNNCRLYKSLVRCCTLPFFFIVMEMVPSQHRTVICTTSQVSICRAVLRSELITSPALWLVCYIG
jgi:hypothetical protein